MVPPPKGKRQIAEASAKKKKMFTDTREALSKERLEEKIREYHNMLHDPIDDWGALSMWHCKCDDTCSDSGECDTGESGREYYDRMLKAAHAKYLSRYGKKFIV